MQPPVADEGGVAGPAVEQPHRHAPAGHREPHLPTAAQPELQPAARRDSSGRRPAPASPGPRHGPQLLIRCDPWLPANLSSCISLTILRIQSNPQLGGRIPPELGNTLPRLEKLQLRKNSLTGEIPASLANLSSLQHLSLSYNKLEGLIPPGLGDIAGLRYLFLNANNLSSGELPISLYNLSSLVMLQVGNNMLHGSIPSDIGRMLPGIQVFGLDVNRFTGVIPPLSNLSTLTDLYLSDNKFTGFVPPNLGRLQSLQYLYLVGNQLEADNTKGWEFLTSLSNCSQLREFVLANNSFSGQLPGQSGTCQRRYKCSI